MPHGQVSQRWYYSKVTGKWRRCYVYTPPDYDANPRTRYPVLYLLHGWGENEQGWHTQGHADFILDNLIAAKKAKPMIIVMDNLNAVKPGEDASLYSARGLIARPDGGCPPAGGRGGARRRPRRIPVNWGATFTDMMFTDLIPMVETNVPGASRAREPRHGRAVDGRHADVPD